MNNKFRDALEALVKKLDACEPHINNAITIATIHGCPYAGPTIEEELKTAKSVLGEANG